MSARYAEYRPAPALRARVECYWTLAGEDVGAHRVLPDGCMDVLFDLAAPREVATLVGTMTTALAVPEAARARYVGVRFRPGEAFAMVGVHAGEVTDQSIPLEDVLGALARSLADEVASAKDDAARFAALDRRLGALRPRATDARVRRVVARILDSPAAARVAWLAREVGASERHLERIFAERVGVGPKQLARVVRLRALLSLADQAPRAPWSALALDAGYADQAHMIREVKRMTGLTPAALARSRAVSDSFNPAAPGSATTGA